MKRIIYIMAAICVMLASGCERRPLLELNNTHYVRVYVDEQLLNVTKGFYNENNARPSYESPDVLRLILADPETGQAIAERFLRDMGQDEKGTYYEGYIIADPGKYTLMAYNYDTETTIVNGSNNHKDAKATTNEIASHLRTKIPSRTKMFNSANTPGGDVPFERIVYDPDHLFAANCGEINVGYVDEVDTLRTPEGEHFNAKSIVKSYYLQVKVQGMEYATSSVGLLTGMSGSSWLNGAGMDLSHNVTLYFEMLPGDNSAAGSYVTANAPGGEVTIYTTFNTFGKLPNAENKLEITFDFLTVYGEPYSETLDITELFYTQEALNNQWLLVDHTIKIPEPPKDNGGGFKPSVDEWGDIETDITI